MTSIETRTVSEILGKALDGERITAGEVLVLAAAEHGDFSAEASLRKAAAKAGRRTTVLAPTTCDVQPQQRARCEEHRHG